MWEEESGELKRQELDNESILMKKKCVEWMVERWDGNWDSCLVPHVSVSPNSSKSESHFPV